MTVIAVVNPKGGVGKTTLATNLAGYFANSQKRTMLGDFDKQQSAKEWLRLVPKALLQLRLGIPQKKWRDRPKGLRMSCSTRPHRLLRKTSQILFESATS